MTGLDAIRARAEAANRGAIDVAASEGSPAVRRAILAAILDYDPGPGSSMRMQIPGIGEFVHAIEAAARPVIAAEVRAEVAAAIRAERIYVDAWDDYAYPADVVDTALAEEGR